MNGNKWITYIIPPEWNKRTVSDVLTGPLLLSNRMINRLTRSRGIRLNGKMPWLHRVVKTGDRLQVALRPRETSDLQPEKVPFGVCYEDPDWIVVDKPAGVTVHPTRPDERGTLVHGLLYYWQTNHALAGKPRPIHRLDRHTSGLLLVAKNAYAHQVMDRQLRQNRMHRTYWAVVHGAIPHPNEGTIDAPIAREAGHTTRRRVDASGEAAVTHYRVRDRSEKATLLQIKLVTGRTHQIRVHLSHMGHPLIGDKLYGGSTHLLRRQALHAQELEFPHPFTGEKIHITSPLPPELSALVKRLGLKP